jgi:tRNA (mo5U34)-methyltransferase
MGPRTEPPGTHSREELTALVESLAWWYHRIYLGHGVYTLVTGGSPAHHEVVWERIRPAFPDDLRGASVLDVGCNAGFFSIEMKRRGAGRVLGIDPMEHFLKQAEACKQIWNLDIEYRGLDVERLPDLGEEFDLVVFPGVLYHLRNPFRALEDVGRICRDAIVVETEAIADDPHNQVRVRQGPLGKDTLITCRKGMMRFIEGDQLACDPTNWWAPDAECLLGMLRVVGFKHFSVPIYLTETRLLVAASKNEHSLLDLPALK